MCAEMLSMHITQQQQEKINMKVHLLFENVNNSTELRDAFDSEQWLRIANYFITNKAGPRWQGSMGDNVDQIVSLMSRINRQIGKDMPVQTTGQWNTVAARYGMDYRGDRRLSWNTIYDHLNARVQEPLPENFGVPGVGIDRGDSDDTRETRNEISTWVDTTTTEWTDYNTLRDEFLIPWSEKLFEERGELFNNWLYGTSEAGNNNMHLNNLISIKDSISNQINNNGSISKDQIIRLLWGWLTSADMGWARYQRNQ